MMNLLKVKGFDDVRCLPVSITVAEKDKEPRVHFGVTSEYVSIAPSGGYDCTTLTTDEAIKLFAGLLEDIKAASVK